MVHLNFHLKYDWVLNCPITNCPITTELSDYKLSDYRFLDELVQNTEVYGPIKFEEIVVFTIFKKIALLWSVTLTIGALDLFFPVVCFIYAFDQTLVE